MSRSMNADNSRRFALEARRAKLSEALSIGVDATYISSFVDRFYDRVLDDLARTAVFLGTFTLNLASAWLRERYREEYA